MKRGVIAAMSLMLVLEMAACGNKRADDLSHLTSGRLFPLFRLLFAPIRAKVCRCIFRIWFLLLLHSLLLIVWCWGQKPLCVVYDAYAWLRSKLLSPCSVHSESANLLRKLLLPHVRAGHKFQILFVQAQSDLYLLTLASLYISDFIV